MCMISFTIPDSLLSELHISKDEITKEAQAALAAELFRTSQLSLGSSAALSGMSVSRFTEYLGKKKISLFDLSEEELIEDFENVRNYNR